MAIAAASFLTGLALPALSPTHHTVTPTVSSSAPASSRTPETPLGPTRTVKGAPAGFAHNEAGARVAAASFVTTGQALLDLDPLAAGQAVRQMASRAGGARQATDALQQLDSVRTQLANGTGRIMFRQAVIAWRVDTYTPDRARVSIWNVGVLARDQIAPPQASWAISTLDLVWEDEDWHLDAETIVPGPAPVLNNSAPAATAVQLVTALDGFTDFGQQP